MTPGRMAHVVLRGTYIGNTAASLDRLSASFVAFIPCRNAFCFWAIALTKLTETAAEGLYSFVSATTKTTPQLIF